MNTDTPRTEHPILTQRINNLERELAAAKANASGLIGLYNEAKARVQELCPVCERDALRERVKELEGKWDYFKQFDGKDGIKCMVEVAKERDQLKADLEKERERFRALWNAYVRDIKENECDQLRAERDQLQKSYDTAGEGIKACREAITALTVKRDTLQNELVEIKCELALSTASDDEKPIITIRRLSSQLAERNSELELARKCMEALRKHWLSEIIPAEEMENTKQSLAAYDKFKKGQQ